MIVTQNQIACHQDRYFAKACSYFPERWLELKKGLSRREVQIESFPFVCLPFGFGPRSCIGRRFAVMEIYVLLIKVLVSLTRKYRYR